MMQKLSFLTAMGATLSVALVTSPASAATYVVDPTSSSVTLAFIFGSTPLTPQVPGADITSFGGTIEATVPLGGGLLTLDSTLGFGDSDIIGLANPVAPFLPSIGGGPLLPGDDGIFADGSVDPLGNGDGLFSVGVENYGLALSTFAFAAIRDLHLTVEGSGITGR
ncbi:MAG: hypothetical protein ACC645_23550, partial [Pirellulales bacterium]